MANKSSFITNDGKNQFFTFALVSLSFLIWEFCNAMFAAMDKHFQQELHLSLLQSVWLQFPRSLAYFLIPLPAGWLAIKLGYKGGIITGLLMVAVGGFWFVPATHIAAFWALLPGVTFIAVGLTFLETIATPYITVLGDPKYAAFRLNLVQSCSSIGVFIGPMVGGMFFYENDHSTGSTTLWIPYGIVAVVFVALAVVFNSANIPDLKMEDDDARGDACAPVSRSIWRRPHFVMGMVTQFFYVAAQAGIFCFCINYITTQVPPLPEAWAAGFIKSWFEAGASGGLQLTDNGVANLTSLGFFLFLAGRFSGCIVLKKFPAHKVLALYGLINVIACLLVFLKLGWLSVAAVFTTYFFMSIMSPSIFALGIHGLGGRAKIASPLIFMTTMGGAFLLKLMGYVGDKFDMSRAFIVPLLCFVVVALYGFSWSKLSKSKAH